MTPDAFTRSLDTLGFSVDGFAERAGVHRTTVYRWLREGDVPQWAEWALSLLVERQQIAEMLSKKL